MSILIPGKNTVVDVGPKKYEQYGPLNIPQFQEIKRQINQGLMMGVPPEQPVSMPTIAVVGLLRLVDELLLLDTSNKFELKLDEDASETKSPEKETDKNAK